jgi:hypothetical protein
MRPYINHPDPSDESDFMSTLGRTRRPVHGEWDDYISLYDDIGDSLIQAIEADLLEPDPEQTAYLCSECESLSPTFRGLKVHLSRAHGIKSARADYFSTRKEACQ